MRLGRRRPGGASVLQTALNVFNVYVGIGVVSLVGAVGLGGWAALGALAVCAALFGVSACALVAAFEGIPPGIPQTYPELGRAAAGRWGHLLTIAVSLLEFSGAGLAVIIVVWQEMAELLGQIDAAAGDAHGGGGGGLLGPRHRESWAKALGFLLMFPTILMDDFRILSYLGWLGLVCCALMSSLIVGCSVLDPARADTCAGGLGVDDLGQCPAGHHGVKLGVAVSTGIFAMSLSGHAALPAIRQSMAEPKKFNWVVAMAFSAMFVTYAVIGGAGYAYFGDAASPLITHDISLHSVLAGRPLLGHSFTLDMLLNALVCLNAYTTIAPVVMVSSEMVLEAMPREAYEQVPERWGGTRRGLNRAGRVCIYSLLCLVALMFYNRILSLEGLTGGIMSMTSSLLLPFIFYWQLNRQSLPRAWTSGIAFVVGFGVAMAIFITAESFSDFLKH